MLSVCSSSYKETDQLYCFLKTLLKHTSDPNNLEIIITNDENDKDTKEVLKMFPQVKIVNYSKSERIEFLRSVVFFYDQHGIFPDNIIDDMYKTISDYSKGKIDSVWYPVTGYKKAIEQATGDMILSIPSDYYCFFDADKIYWEMKRLGILVGHLDWLDLSSLDPMPENLLDEDKNELLKRALTEGLTHIPCQHGARFIDKRLYDEVGGFDDRWFTRAISEDLLNNKLRRKYNSIYNLMEIQSIADLLPYVGALRSKNINPKNYLASNYTLSASVHQEFADPIRNFIRKGGDSI